MNNDSNALGFLLLLALAALAIYVYFVPAIVASRRRHRQRTAITTLNLLLGWTLLGWVGALVWAYTTDTEPPVPASTDDAAAKLVQLREQAGLPPPPTQLSPQSAAAEAIAPRELAPGMKLCPYCAEEVRTEAIKCKHCGSDLRPATT